MSFSHSTFQKPIIAEYTTSQISRSHSYVDLYFHGLNKQPVRYIKKNNTDSEEMNGSYGMVLPFYRSHDEKAEKNELTFEIPEKIAVKELFMENQNEAQIKEESDHTSIVLNWCAHNLDQLNCDRRFILQPFIEDTLFYDMTYRSMSSFFEDCHKILLAIKAFHANGHIHGDIKGDNIFVGKTAKLIDCGLSRYKNELTKGIGPVFHRAPETWVKYIPVDSNQDVYSTGCMFMYKTNQSKEIRFKWNAYLKSRFNKFCSEMMSFDPQSRPTMDEALVECKHLASFAHYLEDEKPAIEEQTDLSIRYLNAILALDLSMKPAKRATLINSFKDSNIRAIKETALLIETFNDKHFPSLSQNNDNSDSSECLLNYLKTDNPEKAIHTIEDLKNIVSFYPQHKISRLLEHIGLDHIDSLIKKPDDLLSLQKILAQETSDLPFVVNDLYDFLMAWLVLLKNVHSFNSLLKTTNIIKSRNIQGYYENDRCSIKLVKYAIDDMMEKRSAEFKMNSHIQIESPQKAEDIKNAGVLLDEMLTHLSTQMDIFPCIEKRLLELSEKMQHSNPLLRPNKDTACIEIFKLAILSLFLCNQIKLHMNDEVDPKNKWGGYLPTAIPTLHQLLEVCLDIHPSCRIDFLNRVGNKPIRQLIKDYMKNVERSDALLLSKFLWQYFTYDDELHRCITSITALKVVLKHYPIHTRMHFLEKLGVEYIKQYLILDKKDLDILAAYLPEKSQKEFIGHGSTKTEEKTSPSFSYKDASKLLFFADANPQKPNASNPSLQGTLAINQQVSAK